MKTCPVCKAQCFDDMSICYGCMYHFPEGSQAEDSLKKAKQDQEEANEQVPEEPPAAVIDQVEAFEPNPPTEAVQMEENSHVVQDDVLFNEEGERAAGVNEASTVSKPQSLILPLEERGLEISIVVRPIGKRA